MLFEEHCAVSIEPHSVTEISGEKGQAMGPAFFQTEPTNKSKKGSNGGITTDAMDVEPDKNNQGKTELSRINADPSLCTFEGAIVKMPSAFGDEHVHEDNAFDTPLKRVTDKRQAALIFRFGIHFSFHVDESAILAVKVAGGETISNQHRDATPPAKRPRNGGTSVPRIDEASAKTMNCTPLCLVITFASCTFRIFCLENSEGNKVSNTEIDKMWGTLTKKSDSLESRFMKAQSVLTELTEVENKEESSPCKRGGRGWPEFFENSSFHSTSLKYEASASVEEDWSQCLRENQAISATVASPQKSISTKSSSTHVEHGQNELASKNNNGSSQPHPKDIAAEKDGNDENAGVSNHSSELSHESATKDTCAQLKPDENENGIKLRKNSEESICERHKKNSHQNPDANKLGNTDNGPEKDEEQGCNHDGFLLSIMKKHAQFEASALHMEKCLDPVAVHSQDQQNITSSSHLTSCANSLSRSYLTANELMEFAQLCENDIKNVAFDIDKILDKMFPPRRKKSCAEALYESKDIQSEVEELMTLRKETVAAKYALLMTPKR